MKYRLVQETSQSNPDRTTFFTEFSTDGEFWAYLSGSLYLNREEAERHYVYTLEHGTKPTRTILLED